LETIFHHNTNGEAKTLTAKRKRAESFVSATPTLTRISYSQDIQKTQPTMSTSTDTGEIVETAEDARLVPDTALLESTEAEKLTEEHVDENTRNLEASSRAARRSQLIAFMKRSEIEKKGFRFVSDFTEEYSLPIMSRDTVSRGSEEVFTLETPHEPISHL